MRNDLIRQILARRGAELDAFFSESLGFGCFMAELLGSCVPHQWLGPNVVFERRVAQHVVKVVEYFHAFN